MSENEQVTLAAATPADQPLLANLLELYIHDMSEIFAVEIGPDGRYGYANLPRYWSEPDRRHPFLIRLGERVVGFALVTRGSPVSDDPDVLDMAEFFVLRRYRRSDVGTRAARMVWTRLPGRWFVRVSEGNRAGVPFWQRVVREHTAGAYSVSTRDGTPHPWRVFSFA